MNTRRSARPHGAALRAPEESFGGESSLDTAGEEPSAPPPSRPSRLFSSAIGALRLGLGLAIVIGTSLLVAHGVHHYALTSPRFAILEVALDGGRRVSPTQARELAGVTLGSNIFALDTAAAEQKLLRHPWVSEARITRELPRRLRVEIKEREAAAVASIAERLYLVSADGQPFKEVEPGDPADFPVITGASLDNLARDRKREIERIASGLEVLRQYERVPLSKQQPAQEVHLADSGDVVLVIGKEGISLALGKEGFRRKLLMAEQVVGELRRKGRAPGIVFLDNVAHPERVVVRMK